MTVLTILNSTIPSGWAISHIMCIDPEWQVNLRSEEHIAVATGETIEEAIANTVIKIANHKYDTKFSVRSVRMPEQPSILTLLNLKPQPKVLRR